MLETATLIGGNGSATIVQGISSTEAKKRFVIKFNGCNIDADCTYAMNSTHTTYINDSALDVRGGFYHKTNVYTSACVALAQDFYISNCYIKVKDGGALIRYWLEEFDKNLSHRKFLMTNCTVEGVLYSETLTNWQFYQVTNNFIDEINSYHTFFGNIINGKAQLMNTSTGEDKIVIRNDKFNRNVSAGATATVDITPYKGSAQVTYLLTIVGANSDWHYQGIVIMKGSSQGVRNDKYDFGTSSNISVTVSDTTLSIKNTNTSYGQDLAISLVKLL